MHFSKVLFGTFPIRVASKGNIHTIPVFVLGNYSCRYWFSRIAATSHAETADNWDRYYSFACHNDTSAFTIFLPAATPLHVQTAETCLCGSAPLSRPRYALPRSDVRSHPDAAHLPSCSFLPCIHMRNYPQSLRSIPPAGNSVVTCFIPCRYCRTQMNFPSSSEATITV